MEIDKLTITISPTADGRHVYVQIASPTAMPVNIVLIAGAVEVNDARAGVTRKLKCSKPSRQSRPKRKPGGVE